MEEGKGKKQTPNLKNWGFLLGGGGGWKMAKTKPPISAREWGFAFWGEDPFGAGGGGQGLASGITLGCCKS